MPSGRGGARSGAGAKGKPNESKKIRMLFTLSPDVAEWIRSKRNSSKCVDQILRKAMDEEAG